MKSESIVLLFLGCFTAISFWIFNKIYATSRLLVDEEFHLRQGLHFCEGRFEIWDPKITTFPGLYLLSTVILAPFKLCSDYYLRLVSFGCQILNFIILYHIRKHLLGHWKVALLEALTLSLLPPLYFFGHLYYTDVPALTMILLTVAAANKGSNLWGTVFGALSVAMRQTNIVWVGMILGVNVLGYVVRRAHPFLKKRGNELNYYWEDLVTIANVYVHRKDLIWTHGKEIIMQFYGHISIMLGFVWFLWYNGSIVVGDKTAHEAALHIPQIFYFSLFIAVFAPSLLLTRFKSTKSFIKYWYIYAIIAGLLILVVRNNTLVHPYLLADNRHYTFYIWNRFYARYDWFKYAMIPVYIFSLSSIFYVLKDQQSVGFLACYIVCTLASIAFQKLLDPRYFLIPYIMLRIHLRHIEPKYIVMELILYLALNAATMQVFFTKEIWWENYTDAQRLMW